MTGMEKMIELAREVQKKIPGYTLAGGTSLMFKYQHREYLIWIFAGRKAFPSIIYLKKCGKCLRCKMKNAGKTTWTLS